MLPIWCRPSKTHLWVHPAPLYQQAQAGPNQALTSWFIGVRSNCTPDMTLPRFFPSKPKKCNFSMKEWFFQIFLWRVRGEGTPGTGKGRIYGILVDHWCSGQFSEMSEYGNFSQTPKTSPNCPISHQTALLLPFNMNLALETISQSTSLIWRNSVFDAYQIWSNNHISPTMLSMWSDKPQINATYLNLYK